ncbi:MAG: isopentenyl phosphate kinase [Nitrososphaerota archaeon]
MERLQVLKIGGSVLTDKRAGRGELREELLREIFTRIREEVRGPLILVHGGGSEVHRVAVEHGVSRGIGHSTPEGFVRTALEVRRVNLRVTELMLSSGLLPFSVPASLAFRTSGGAIRSANLEPFLASLELGMTPVTCGDVVFDRELGFTVLSGDTIAVYLAVKLRAARIVHATDVDGVLVRDPEGRTRVLPAMDYETHRRTIYTEVPDATGGMATKVEEAFEAVNAGVEVVIVNGLKPERVIGALRGDRVEGTYLVKDLTSFRPRV